MAKDLFARGDNPTSINPAEKGGSWITSVLTFGILSGHMFAAGASIQVGQALLGAATDAKMTLTVFSQDFNRYLHCMAFRLTDINNCIFVQHGNTAVVVNNVVAGVVTSLGSFPAAFANSNQYDLALTVEGDTLEFFQNGVLKLAMFLPAAAMAQTGNLTGIRMLVNGGAASSVNNWCDNYSVLATSPYAEWIALDTIQRVNSGVSPGTATEKGGAWNVIVGSAGVNAATIYSLGGTDTKLLLGDTAPSANVMIQNEMVSDDWLNHEMGQLFRVQDSANFLTMVITGPINASLRSCVAGSLVAFASWSPALTNSVSAKFRSQCVGNQFTSYINDVVVANFPMTGAPLTVTGTKTGMWMLFGSTLVNFWNYMVQ